MNSEGDILIVDDAYASLKLLADILTAKGYQVRPADSGELALTSVAAKLPDLILLDIRMPGMDGFEVLRRLKANEESRNIPIIFLSASVGMDEQVEGLKLGAVDYISKPFQSEELLARVQTQVELSRLRIRLEQQAVELRQSEQQYRSLFENMLEGFAYCKLLYDENNQPADFIYLDVNNAFEQLTGLKNVVGKPVSEVIPGIKKLSPELFESYGRVASTGKPERFEFDLKSLNQWLSISVYSPGKNYFVAVFDNITERKQAEEKIRRNEARLRSLVHVLQYNAKTTQEFLDNALNEAIKLTESKIGYIYFYHEDRKQFVLNTWSKDVMKECSIVEPQTCYELDKTGVWGEAVRQRKSIILNDFQSSHPFKKGYPEGHAHLTKFLTVPVFRKDKIVAVVGVANKASDYDEIDELQLSLLMDAVWNSVDIKQTGEALSESEERFRSVSQTAYDAIVTADSNGIIIGWNHGAEKIFGYLENEILGQSLSIIIPQEYKDRHLIGMKRLIKGGEPHVVGRIVELHGLHKNGDTFPLELSLAEWATYKGKFFTGIIRDITERKKAEQALREAVKEREKLIEELQFALDNVKTLQGFIPICANCKKIRDDQGFWNQVEGYISQHTDAKFSHGICPECAKELYGDVYNKVIENISKKKI